MKNQKLRVSRDQFAEVLYHWLSLSLTENEIRTKAKDFGLEIKSDKDFSKIFEELLAFNMWIIVYTCEGVIEDEDKRNTCLDIFHHLVYKRHTEGKDEDFGKWMGSLATDKYGEYYTAIETDHPSNPSWVLAKVFNKNLFGEIKEDLFIQMNITAYFGFSVEHLGKILRKYDIE